MIKNYIGDKKFYKNLMVIAIPFIVESFITNLVSMIDNIMVGQIGTAQMSGVSIVNQVLFVMNLCIFGAVSGAGIFTAQYAGSGDQEGLRYTVRFKIYACLVISALGIIIYSVFGNELIGLYLRGEGSAEEASDYLYYGMKYLKVMVWGFPPLALANAYNSTLRENGQTFVPMCAGLSSVAVNLILNYIFIFGKLGFPEMGVTGAALATVISRFVELGIGAVWTHMHAVRMPFVKGLYSSPRVPKTLVKRIAFKGMPLVINEGLWAAGTAFLNQCYSIRGLNVVAALNISTTISNTMNSAVQSLGNAIGIKTGQQLGSGAPEKEIMGNTKKYIAFSVAFSLIFVAIEIAAAGVFPKIYNTSDEVRSLASRFILIFGVMLAPMSFTNATYFILRSGGKTVVTILFDSCFVCLICVPVAFVLSRFTSLSILPLYFICQSLEIIKCVLGVFMLRSKSWIQNIAVK